MSTKNVVTDFSDGSIPVGTIDHYELGPEMNVYQWSPDPPGTVNARCTQVHLHVGSAGTGRVYVMRFKSPHTLDALIEALQSNRKDVWG